MTQEIFQLFSNLNFNWSVIESLCIIFSVICNFLVSRRTFGVGGF